VSLGFNRLGMLMSQPLAAIPALAQKPSSILVYDSISCPGALDPD
jgi:hypothetical protein